MNNVSKSTVIDTRTVPGAGTTTVATVLNVGGISIAAAEQLIIYLQVTTTLTGTTPTMDIYLQRALVPNPNPATAAHWQDILHFLQATGVATNNEQVAVLPVQPVISNSSASIDAVRVRAVETEAADVAMAGFWADQIRIREVMGGTPTGGVYSLHITAVTSVS